MPNIPLTINNHNRRLRNCWMSFEIQKLFQVLEKISLKSLDRNTRSAIGGRSIPDFIRLSQVADTDNL